MVHLSLVFILMFSILVGGSLQAEDETIPVPSKNIDDKGYAKLKVFSKKNIEKVCEEYEGKYIGYYGKVYYVSKCKRHLLQTRDALWRLSKENKLVVQVENDTIASLQAGEPIDQVSGLTTLRGCKSLNGKYLTADYVSIYYMKNCKLYDFPDWESFKAHRKVNKTEKDPIEAMTSQALFRHGNSTTMKSVIDEEIKNLLDATEEVDVIPVDEACAGLNNTYVSYYSRLYKIEKCRKREVNPVLLLEKLGGKISPKELSSEQWISLPDGKPIEL